MRKFVMICLTVLMIATFGFASFAETGGFVSSPSGNSAPELIVGKNESESCVAELIITAYGDRDKMSAEARQEIEKAYSNIVGTQDISTLDEKVAEIAEQRNVSASSLAVSDLFDISETQCEGHEDHGYFNIVISAETLNNFVCLLHYYNDEWVVVDNAKVSENGESLEFSVDEFSPFAIVVSAAEEPAEPDDNNGGFDLSKILLILIIIMVAALLIALFFFLL